MKVARDRAEFEELIAKAQETGDKSLIVLYGQDDAATWHPDIDLDEEYECP